MLKNYFKIAIRNLWKNKGFSFINIFGLAVGIAVCLLIILFVIDELSYDKFNKNSKYQVILLVRDKLLKEYQKAKLESDKYLQ